MNGILDVADVEQVPGWRAREQFDSIGCALISYTLDVCTPNRADVEAKLSGPSSAGSTSGPEVTEFAVLTSMPYRLVCRSGEEGQVVQDAMLAETEKAVGRELVYGLGGTADAYIAGTDTTIVSAGGNDGATLAALLRSFWDNAVGISAEDTIVHLGISKLISLFGPVEGGVVKNLGVRVASSPGYPTTLMAVTGPVKVKLGSIQELQGIDTAHNAGVAEATRMASIQYDPCMAVATTVEAE